MKFKYNSIMKRLLLVYSLMFICVISASARILRVNNNTSSSAQFSTFKEAYENSVTGDSIYLEGSIDYYTPPASIEKKITIMGAGYKLKDNDVKNYGESDSYI